jgi:lipopolysaccharide/colanic/teichoic acid biosynthesis glycosyltransferase
VNGRNAVAWPERLEYDVRYVEMLGRATAPLTDLWIAVLTACQLVSQAITGRGISAPGAATMQEFAP